jgi:hypothetical protein
MGAYAAGGSITADIADAIDQLLRTELIVVVDSGIIDRALAAYRAGGRETSPTT